MHTAIDKRGRLVQRDKWHLSWLALFALVNVGLCFVPPMRWYNVVGALVMGGFFIVNYRWTFMWKRIK